MPHAKKRTVRVFRFMNSIAWSVPAELIESALSKVLEESLSDAPAEVARLRSAMRYAVFSGGKRLRSQLVTESAAVMARANGNFQSQNPAPPKVLGAACALELIHAYSLVHDDLPAMDNADLRRGRPSCHRQFDEATAILVGDALLTLAFEVLCEGVATNNGLENDESQDMAQSTLKAVQLVARAAGEAGMVGGQAIDIAWSNEHVTQVQAEALLQMHAMKTGALIRCASETGAILGNGTYRQVAALRDYGVHLGRAFQIHDDVLDVEGDPLLTGKDATDAANFKITAPAVFGLERAKQMADEAGCAAYEALNDFGEEAQALRELARFVTEREK